MQNQVRIVYYKTSQAWLQEVHTAKTEGILSTQNLTEFTSVYLRFPLKDTGLAVKNVNKSLASFTSGLFRFIYPTSETVALFKRFLVKYPTSPGNVFDLFLVATMVSNGISQILTYNEKDFIGYNEIKVINPDKFHE